MKELSLGELLVRKAEAGVKVLILVWSDISDQMGTHDNDTYNFFKGEQKHWPGRPVDMLIYQAAEWSAV